MKCYCILFIFLIFGTSVYGRVPPRNHETEETPANDKENPILTPVERSPIDSSINNENPIDKQTTNRKPIGVILFRTQPAFSFRERSPFSPAFPLSPHHHHFSNLGSDANEDPALRLISILFGRHQRPILPTESTDTETANTSNESSSAETTDLERRHPFESLFPSIFVPRLDEFDKEMGSETITDDKTPDNFENKEKKVITISGKKFVKTTQVKKVKNDFGQFHSVISSLQPFDEKLHDENGNDKIKPDLDNKETVEKKQVESSTASSEKVDSSTAKSVQFDSSTAASVDKEEVTELKETSSPKPNEKLLAENLSKDVSKNEIPDKKETEIKVDQMN